jgi:hypothetical protein
MTTILSLTIYKYKILLNTIRELIVLFVLAYGDDDTPDSTLEDQMAAYNDLSLDYFDFLHGVPCTGTQEEHGALQLGGAPPTGTQEGGGTQPGGSQLPGAPPTGTHEGGGTQPSPGGLPEVAAGGAGRTTRLQGLRQRWRHRLPLLMLGVGRSTHVTCWRTLATRRGTQPKQIGNTRRRCVARLSCILVRQHHSYSWSYD